MKKILLGIVGGFAVLAVGLVGYASTQPDTYHVERSATYDAAPADVFPYVNDYTKWATWNPFADMDPAMKTAISENPVGVGAWNTWEGNAQVGKGKMTVVESVPEQKVVHKLEFFVPMEDVGTATHTLTANGESTTLTWAMDGQMNLLSKVMCVFMGGMDDMLGPTFESGLKRLGPTVESDKKARVAREEEAAAAAAAAVVVDPAAAPVEGAPATP